MAKIVKDQDYSWSDFFIFAASGTDDFAYSAFKQQIEAMLNVKDSVLLDMPIMNKKEIFIIYGKKVVSIMESMQ